MRVHLLNDKEAEALRAGSLPNCESHGHMPLVDALKAEKKEEITFVQGFKYAIRQRPGVQAITADRNEVGETGMVHTVRR